VYETVRAYKAKELIKQKSLYIGKSVYGLFLYYLENWRIDTIGLENGIII
jgi:hypothetical protein